MKNLPAFAIICSTLSLFACNDSSNSDNANVDTNVDATSFTITDANVVEVMTEVMGSQLLDRVIDATLPEDSDDTAAMQSRKAVTDNDTIACASGSIEVTSSYDDEGLTQAVTSSYIIKQCLLEGGAEGETLNGSYSVSIAGEDPITMTMAMDLSDATMTIKGKATMVEYQAGNYESSYEFEMTSEKYGHCSVQMTGSGTDDETLESESGTATFANDTITWVSVANGVDITLQSTGSTQFISNDELD